MARKGKAVVSGLDIGTSGMVTAVPGVERALDLPVGIGRCPSLGIRKGLVVDHEAAARSIRRAVDAAAEAAGVRIDTVCAGFSGYGINVIRRRADITLRRTIMPGDINHLLNLARRVELPAGRQVLHVVPVDFILDGVPGIKNPLGKPAVHLGVAACVLTVDSRLVGQLLLALKCAGVRVAELCLNSLAAGEAVLKGVEKELGVALVDLGGGTTGVTLFCDGGFWDQEVLPVGGEHITSDLAIGLRVSLAMAGEIKHRAGLSAGPEKVKLPGQQPVAAHEIAEIIQLRVQEILDIVKQTILRLSAGRTLTAGVVLTGGGVLLEGLPEMASRVLDMPVRVGVPDCPPPWNSPDLAASWGLAAYARRLRFSVPCGAAGAADSEPERKSVFRK
ncbi:cell division protein FtsA [Desulfotomaculum copahuensis]|uniref:Cell division protein FtsA n=1 Tax=Desulfotomaculum copahuensis TaxID=1838280 RepID=A0A1B7LEW3_9FIRM|nr:cell division protein FtsA [Desulfotomaculum copahuensis]OAT81798.1 cell division protein FtsA [Desulfotomaculum copahuensis]